MSMEGIAKAKNKVRGRVSKLDVLLLSAYAIAVKNGFDGTEEEWLVSLKGDKGDRGEPGTAVYKGDKGDKGDPGHTPVKGEDYWTEEEQAEIQDDCVDYISTELAKRGQLTPEFANSIADCTDTTKLYVLPDGMIYAYMADTNGLYTNQLFGAVDSDGSPYNGGKGWKTDTRLNSGGTESAQDGIEVTGFVPVKFGDVVYLKNVQFIHKGTNADKCYITAYNSNFSKIADWRADSESERSAFVFDDNNVLTKITLKNAGGFSSSIDNVAYLRICADEINGGSIITVNEEIVETTERAWQSTGHAFVPADYEDRIIAAEKDIDRLEKAVAGDMAVYGIVDSENNIIMTGSLESGKYTLKYMAEDGTTIDICEFTM